MFFSDPIFGVVEGRWASRRWHEPVCIVKRLEGVPPPPPAPAGCRTEEPAPGEAMLGEAMPGEAMPGELEFP